MLVRRIARPLMSTIFIAGGIDALRNPDDGIKTLHSSGLSKNRSTAAYRQ